MCCLTIRAPDLRSVSDKIPMFVIIDILSHLAYHLQKSSNDLILREKTFLVLFRFLLY